MHLDCPCLCAVVVLGCAIVVAPSSRELTEPARHPRILVLEVPRHRTRPSIRQLSIEVTRLLRISRAIRRQLRCEAVDVDPKFALRSKKASRFVEPSLVPVKIFGGTAVERDTAMAAARNVLAISTTGQQMRAVLEKRTDYSVFGQQVKTLEIVITNGYHPGNGVNVGSFTYVNSNTIAIDANQIGQAYTSLRPGGVFSYERIIAHELGHAAFGDTDTGIDNMFNVKWNENWVMNELGDANDRLSY